MNQNQYNKIFSILYPISFLVVVNVIVGSVLLLSEISKKESMSCDLNRDGQMSIVDLSILAEDIRNSK